SRMIGHRSGARGWPKDWNAWPNRSSEACQRTRGTMTLELKEGHMSASMQSTEQPVTESDATVRSDEPNARRRRWRGPKLGKGPMSVPDREVRADCRCRNAYGEVQTHAEEIVLDVREL